MTRARHVVVPDVQVVSNARDDQCRNDPLPVLVNRPKYRHPARCLPTNGRFRGAAGELTCRQWVPKRQAISAGAEAELTNSEARNLVISDAIQNPDRSPVVIRGLSAAESCRHGVGQRSLAQGESALPLPTDGRGKSPQQEQLPELRTPSISRLIRSVRLHVSGWRSDVSRVGWEWVMW
jgi:hypothetical protein